MIEQDIRGNGLALLHVIGKHIAEDCPPNQKAEAEMLVEGVGNLVIQAFVDLNRIANALEFIAKSMPGPQV